MCQLRLEARQKGLTAAGNEYTRRRQNQIRLIVLIILFRVLLITTSRRIIAYR